MTNQEYQGSASTIKKRKLVEEGQPEPQGGHHESDQSQEKIDVTFEFCDLNSIDYHAIKHLISQLFRIGRTNARTRMNGSSTPKTKTKTKTHAMQDSIHPIEQVEGHSTLRADPVDSSDDHPRNLNLLSSSETSTLHSSVEDFLDVAQLTDLILGDQKEWVGCTVKCDEEDCDPYAFISILDLRAYQANSSVISLTNYLRTILRSIVSNQVETSKNEVAYLSDQRKISQELLGVIDDALKPGGRGIGVVFNERLINMPVQIVPQLFTQLGNEIKHAKSKGAIGFGFELILIPSRVFRLRNEEGGEGSNSKSEVNPTFDDPSIIDSHHHPPKKSIKMGNHSMPLDCNSIGLYHPEDYIISQFASHTLHYDLQDSSEKNNGKEEAGDNFGVEQMGRLMLIELSKWDQMVQSLHNYISENQQ